MICPEKRESLSGRLEAMQERARRKAHLLLETDDAGPFLLEQAAPFCFGIWLKVGLVRLCLEGAEGLAVAVRLEVVEDRFVPVRPSK